MRNQGMTIEIKMIAPVMDESVLTNIRKESKPSKYKNGLMITDIMSVNRPPSRLSTVSISGHQGFSQERFQRSTPKTIPFENRFMIRPRGYDLVNKTATNLDN